MFKHLYMKFILGLDIGGTHIAGALVNEKGELLAERYHKNKINTGANSRCIIEEWGNTIRNILKGIKTTELSGIGIAMPGPFDYENGISLIKALGKYDALYGMNIKDALKKELNLPQDFPVYFKNDAACFALGESWKGRASVYHRVLAITLGTGLGAAFLIDGEHIQEGNNIPEGGTLYQVPYKKGKAEDHFSARGLLKEYALSSGEMLKEVKTIYERAIQKEPEAIRVFENFGKAFATFLAPRLRDFKAEGLVLGGSISKAACFFINEMKEVFTKNNLSVEVMISELEEKAAILGAASLLQKISTGYDMNPSFHLEDGKINEGINSLAAYILKQKTVTIDGYAGVFWKKLKSALQSALPENIKVNIQETSDWFLPEEKINELVKPYLGKEGAVWGTKCDKELTDLFDKEKIKQYKPDPKADINILLGTGAALSSYKAPVIYFDLPKNELQYRMRAGSSTNLGCSQPEEDVQMYKRFYFVDWVLLNRHKKNILENIDVIVDTRQPDTITWTYFKEVRKALQTMSENVFRARPWFEPGAWGGQWLKRNIAAIDKKKVNYAWSFELITPENGLLFESNGLLLEISFDFLMLFHNGNVLGEKNARRFGDEFPIRFDFLDTIEGGNLSIQCHPSLKYIREHFGEKITQDETYYILEAEEEAGVYLGFQEDIDPDGFRKELEQSNEKKQPVEITDYVQYHPAKKHDLFLIPNGTVHSAAAGNLVLEISATPYIFTFKMYDWLRLDLNGNPRPINIEHAFNNLNFERKGKKVCEELISKPYVLHTGENWKQIHLPTHPAHFYDVQRYEFFDQVEIETADSCNVLMLVEGSAVLVRTKNGVEQRFHYAETFVIPAAAESYTLINEGSGEAKVVKAFLK